MEKDQLSLFAPSPSLYPEGFRYEDNIISEAQEARLIENLQSLPFKEFEFQGYKGKRRVVSYGWQYDFNTLKLKHAEDMPQFILDLRTIAARFAGLDPSSLHHVLVTEYSPGAGIGWHKDRPVFEDVIGISLLASCNFRLRKKEGSKWLRQSLTACPRSAYLLSRTARWEWEHSIPPVDELRYSVTFRNFKSEIAAKYA